MIKAEEVIKMQDEQIKRLKAANEYLKMLLQDVIEIKDAKGSIIYRRA